MEGDIFPLIVECYAPGKYDDPPVASRLVYTEEESVEAHKEFAEQHPGGYLVNVPPY